MSRVVRIFFQILSVCLGLFLIPFSATAAEPASQSELEIILQKIESRYYRWIAIRADIILFFATAGNSRAMCGGELLYNRLDERMFLTCADSQKNLVFAFRTLDRRFDLYLPDQKTVYHGSIFDMEDSPEIESHLKPRDLYRALKPSAADPRHIEIGRNNLVITHLDVYTKKGDREYLSRKLYLTPEGDVRGELYFNAEGRIVTELQRYDFQNFGMSGRNAPSLIFPKKITLLSPETKKGTAIFFAKVSAVDPVDSLEFLLRVPEGTQEVFLEEKDPRFAIREHKISEKETPELETEKKKEVAKPSASLSQKSKKAVKTTPQTTRPTIPSKKKSKEKNDSSKEADIVVEKTTPHNNTAPSTSSQESSLPIDSEGSYTSLDPSVPPPFEIEQIPEPEGPIVRYPKQDDSKEVKNS